MMRSPLKRFFAVSLSLFYAVEFVAAADAHFDVERLKQIPARMQEFIQAGQIAGAVTVVATPAETVHLGAVGQADLASNRPMQTDAIFRIASMTKPITAVGLMLLVEEGKVGIDDPVSKYIPSFAEQKLKDGTPTRPVTIRDVLTHTAGLSQPNRSNSGSQTLWETAHEIGTAPLAFPPGSQWQYSSGLTVAGRIIEIASGQEYAAFLKARIFEPLDMVDTTFTLTSAQVQRLATTYKPGKEAGTLEAVEIPDPTVARMPNPSGGLYSTAADLTKFYQTVLTDLQLDTKKLLPKSRLQEMTQILTPGIVTGFTPGNGWGLGICVVEHPQGVTRLLSPGTFGHGGAWGTQGWIDPQRQMILILLIQRTNFGNSDGSDVRDAFTELAVTAYRGPQSLTARIEKFGRYSSAVKLTSPTATAVICPEAGGRVLKFARNNLDAMYLDPKELDEKSTETPPMTAGRFDVGPELTIAKHPDLWAGTWTTEITGPTSVRLVSPRDANSGLQLIRDFYLGGDGAASRLTCRQTICNTSDKTIECCHWGRSFSPGGGICLIPLAGVSKFPSKYAMYEDSAIINVRNTDPLIRERDGFLEILAPPRKPKLGFDTMSGTLAYVLPNNSLFVKRFVTDPDRVYNEAAGLTLSVWYPEGPRIELEPIGPRERLQPGEVASFTEDWWLTEFDFPAAGQSVDLTHLRSRLEALPR